MSQEFYSIEENQVVLHATKWFDKRVVTSIEEKNKEATLGFLQDKFVEIEKDTMVLKAEYIIAEEKVKLAGRIQRHRQYLATVKAIGDYSTIFVVLDEMEVEIKRIIEDNIGTRLKLVGDVEAIIKSDADWKQNTEKISEIAKQLKALPLVPDPRIEELKNKFDQLRDDFFTKKKGHFEGQETILLDNLAHKLELCEKAEACAASTEWKKTTEELAALNEEWKKIGHVPRHRSDEIWLRFNNAKDIFFNKKRENFETIKVDQETALKTKLELIEKAVALKDSRDWKKTSDAYELLLREWKASGRVSNETNDEVWAKFNEPRNFFYDAKNTYYNSVKLNLEDNFSKKAIIVTRAEELAEQINVEWDSATQEMMEMTEDWKKIGRVAKEHGDELWERFLKAKRTFFDRKDAEREKRRSEGGKVLDEKVNRNRSYSSKLERELQLEEEILIDFKDRLNNIVPGVRSFETQERYETIIGEAEKKVLFLKNKIKDVKANMQSDEKDMRQFAKPFKKKEDGKPREDFKPRENYKPRESANAEPKEGNFKQLFAKHSHLLNLPDTDETPIVKNKKTNPIAKVEVSYTKLSATEAEVSNAKLEKTEETANQLETAKTNIVAIENNEVEQKIDKEATVPESIENIKNSPEEKIDDKQSSIINSEMAIEIPIQVEEIKTTSLIEEVTDSENENNSTPS
jgi:Domain of Unknown Function (DUF349)